MRDSRTLRALRRAYVASARQAPVRVHVRRRAPEVYERDLPGVLQVPHVRTDSFAHASTAVHTVATLTGRRGLCRVTKNQLAERAVPLYVSVALAQVS